MKQAPQNDLGDAVRGLISLKKQPTRAIHSSFHSLLSTSSYQTPSTTNTILASHLQQANSSQQQGNITGSNSNGQSLQAITLGLPLQQQQQQQTMAVTSSSTHQQELNPSPNGPNGLNDASTNPSHGLKRLRKVRPFFTLLFPLSVCVICFS